MTGTTGTRVVSPPSTTSPTGRGPGTSATRCVSASVTGSSRGRSPSVIARRCRGRPFVHAATPVVRASLPMRSPSPTAGPVVATPRDRTPRAPRQSRGHLTSTSQRYARPRFTNRCQSLGRTRRMANVSRRQRLICNDAPHAEQMDRPQIPIEQLSDTLHGIARELCTGKYTYVDDHLSADRRGTGAAVRRPAGHNRRGERPRHLIVIRRRCVTQAVVHSGDASIEASLTSYCGPRPTRHGKVPMSRWPGLLLTRPRA